MAKDVVLTCVFLQKSYIFRFLASDSISQPHGEGDFTIHYTIDIQLLGILATLFCFVYKCDYLRALTIYVWSEHSLWDFVVFAVVVFVVSSFLFPFFSFFREVFVLFSFKLRSSFAPRRVASCQTSNSVIIFAPIGGIGSGV
jgi:hypothetical protein